MPVLKHKTPCKECPFRRASTPGWLGASTPEEFMASARSGAEMPCHSSIDYEQSDWRTKQYPKAPLCAGSLIFLKNSCTLPRDPALAASVKAVEGDRETVFNWPHEFLAHHDRETVA
jgi:hypothetical protein